jgi:hypothetical protein
MKLAYHRSITTQALQARVSPRALESMIRANLAQDGLHYQLGHDHFHFDSDRFDEGYAYMEEQRALVRDSLQQNNIPSAWQTFGRLTHSAQDFYAHSNYIRLWLDRFGGSAPPPPPEVDPVFTEILQHPHLSSGKLYYPFEALTFLPFVGRLFVPFMPPDSHAHMNHDGPDNSALWDYVFHAAVNRTAYEFEKTAALLPPAALRLFTDQ